MRNRLGRKPQGINRKTPGTSKHSKAVGHEANIQILQATGIQNEGKEQFTIVHTHKQVCT